MIIARITQSDFYLIEYFFGLANVITFVKYYYPCVTHLTWPRQITEEDLRSFFSTYGPIKHCKILSDSNGMSKGFSKLFHYFIKYCDPLPCITQV